MLPLLTSPWALAALASLPALTALYWMRHSYRRVPVSSLMLWRDQSESRASGLRLRRLQTPILFFLELAALALLALAASGPRIEVGRGSPPLIVILDDSLSMRASGEDSSRRRAQLALENDLRWSGVSSVRFVLAGTQPQALGEPTTRAVEAREILADWQCLAPQAKIAEAIAFATELGGDSARILVVTDRPRPETMTLDRVLWWAFGEPRANLAIVRAGRTARDKVDRCYLEIANYSPGPREATLVVEANGVESNRQHLSLGPRETRRVSYDVAADALVEAKLLDEDALELDNRAFLVHDTLPPVRVDVQIAAEAVRVPIDKVLKATGKTLPPGYRPHLVFTDSPDVPEGAAAESWVVHILAEDDADAFLGPFVLDRTHLLAEGLGLDGVIWGAGKSHDFPGVPILLAGNVPLVTDSRSANGQHRLRVRLRSDLSTLPQSPGWPVLFWNLIQWRAKDLPGLERANLRLGDAASLSLRAGVERVAVKPPTGPDQTFAVRGGRVAIPTEQIGIYEIADGDGGTHVAVSMANAEESDLSTCATGRWGEWPDDDAAAPGVVHLAWMLALLVLAIMSAHLFLANRGFQR